MGNDKSIWLNYCVECKKEFSFEIPTINISKSSIKCGEVLGCCPQLAP